MTQCSWQLRSPVPLHNGQLDEHIPKPQLVVQLTTEKADCEQQAPQNEPVNMTRI